MPWSRAATRWSSSTTSAPGRRENIVHLLDSGRAVFVEGSVLDADLVDEWVERTDSCFHLASAVGVKLVVDNPLESLLRNVRGANVVAHAAARYGRRLLFTSTSEVYGKHSNGALPEDSDSLLGPTSKSRWGYANTKAFGEMLAFGYARERGAQTVVVRLFNSVGPRQLGSYGMVLPRFVSQALKGEDLTVYGDGTQSRCFTHVYDTVEAIVAVADVGPGRGRRLQRRRDAGDHDPGAGRAGDRADRIAARGSATSPTRRPTARASRSSAAAGPTPRRSSELCGWRPRRTIDDAIDDLAAPDRGRQRGEGARGEQAAGLTGGLEEAAELSH